MKDFILFMHNDFTRDDTTASGADWPAYFEKLRSSGRFQGGSSIGGGACLKKSDPARPISESLGGYIRVLATDLEDAKCLIEGNPVYEAGGTVEVRELTRDD